MKTRWIAPIAVLAVLALAGPALAQVKYVDDKGISHWVQNESMVPEKYRAKADTHPALPQVIRSESPTKGLDLEERRLNADAAMKNAQRPAVPDTPTTSRELSAEDQAAAENIRRLGESLRAREAAEVRRRIESRCDSVRSDQATPALLAQCMRILGR